MNINKHAIIDPVDSRTTLTIVKEILSWSDDHWKSHEANLSTEQKLEMRQELEDLGGLFGKMKSHDYNWRKAVLVCLPEKYVGVIQEHFLAAGARLHAPNESLKSFAQYCSHKNLLEYFYANDGEQAPSSVSHSLTSTHAELREVFVADLYKGLAKVLKIVVKLLAPHSNHCSGSTVMTRSCRRLVTRAPPGRKCCRRLGLTPICYVNPSLHWRGMPLELA